MKAPIKKLFIAAVLITMLCSGCTPDTAPDTEVSSAEATEEKVEIKRLQVGDKAPDFSVELVNGGSFKLSDYSDGVVLLNFWATWCPPCVGEMPAFEKLKNDGIDNFHIICVNCMEDKKTVDTFVKNNGYTFNIGYDEKGTVEAYYPTDGIPYTLIINKGEVAEVFVGAYSEDVQYKVYKDAIKKCIGKK